MDTSTMIIVALLIVGGITGLYVYFYFRDKKLAEPVNSNNDPKSLLALRLQAYERLVLLADRIAIPSLVSRFNQGGLSAREMQSLLVQTIRQEFEHNITQQIYVSAEAWDAVRNLKEQNLLIVNKVSSFLPEGATSSDLSKSLMELLMENPNASLHMIVSDALTFEAKKLM